VASTGAHSWLDRVFGGASRQSVADVGNIHLLFVTQPGTDACMGMASRLYITREEPNDDGVRLATRVGPDMKISFDEGLRYVRKLPRGWEKDFSVRLSFEDKFTPKDGGSAGTGFTIAMQAAIQNVALDPALAVTGDLTVDGSVQPVGAVVEKLRGAISDKCHLILIPERNAGDAEDLALLDGTAPLWEAQIFSIATIEDAFSLARRDRAEATAAAIARFDALRARLPAKVTPNFLQSPIVQEELKAVLQSAPNHLSAAILLRASQHQLHKSLSLERSVDEIISASYLFVQGVFPHQASAAQSSATESQNKSGGITLFPEREYEGCVNKLYRLSSLLDPRSVELKGACIDYAGALRAIAGYHLAGATGIRDYQQLYEIARREQGYQREYLSNLNDSRSRLILALRKLSTDESLRRDMRK
jgi:hypothetical protein